MKIATELSKYKRAEIELRKKRREAEETRLLEILKDVSVENGFTKKELAGELLKKKYVTRDDEQYVYEIIKNIRKKSNMVLACRNSKFGWAYTKEDIDLYRLSNLNNGASKMKSNINAWDLNYKAIGIQEDPTLLIGGKIGEFGFKFAYGQLAIEQEEAKKEDKK